MTSGSVSWDKEEDKEAKKGRRTRSWPTCSSYPICKGSWSTASLVSSSAYSPVRLPSICKMPLHTPSTCMVHNMVWCWLLLCVRNTMQQVVLWKNLQVLSLFHYTSQFCCYKCSDLCSDVWLPVWLFSWSVLTSVVGGQTWSMMHIPHSDWCTILDQWGYKAHLFTAQDLECSHLRFCLVGYLGTGQADAEDQTWRWSMPSQHACCKRAASTCALPALLLYSLFLIELLVGQLIDGLTNWLALVDVFVYSCYVSIN